MEISDSQLDTAIRNADAAGRIEDVQSLSREYNRRQKKKVINEDESINDNELETAIRNADKAGRTEDVQALAVEYNRRKQASEQDRGLVEEASYLADDFANQFNLGVANVIGAPVDLISFGLNKVSNAIIDEDIVSPDAFGGSASIKNAMKSIGTRDEAPRTKAGYIGGVSGEAVGFTMPLLKVAQTATKAQAVTKAGQVAQNVAKDFVDEAVNKTGRLLAIESGAATTAGLAREYAENENLSPGTSLAVEILAGVAGGFAGAGAYKIPKSLLKKVQGKNATEIMEMVSNGSIEYKELDWALESKPLFKDDGAFNMDAPEATPASKPIIQFKKDGVPYKIEGTYIRFGDLPDGPSNNFVTGGKEEGHSVYLAYFDPKTKKYVIQDRSVEVGVGTLDQFIAGTADGSDLNNRTIYEISGNKIGRGQDGEPILDASTSQQVKEIKRSDVVLVDEPFQDIDLQPLDKDAGFNVDDATMNFPEGFKLADYTYKKNDAGSFDIFKDGKIVEDELRLFGKSEIKTEDVAKDIINRNIDEDLLDFKIAQKETPEPTPATKTSQGTMPGVVRESFEFQAARQEIANNVSNKQKVEAAVALNNLDNYAPDAPLNPKRIINKILSVFAPSKLLGNDIVNEIEMAKGTINRAQELGARVKRVVGRLEEKDPTVRESVDVFLKGGEMAPSLEPVKVELIKWRETIQELQNTLLQGMDDEVFEGLSKAGKKEVLETIEASIEQGYLTQTYKIFQDPDYRPTKAQEDAALKEIQLKIMMGADAGTMTMPQAEDLARKQMDHLRKSSARQRKAEGRQQGAVKESKGILRERSNPGPAERAWLGEVKDPKERAFSTANRLARLASSKAEDVAIAKFLLDSGVATRRPANPDQVQMKFRTIEGDSSVFIDPEVAHSLDMLRFGEANTVKSGIAGYLDKIWNTWVGTSKSTKVLLNPESYMVNLFGAVASTISSGIIPTPKGFRAALSDFGSLDDLLSGKNTVGRRALLDDIDKMNQYGLKPKSVNAADIEQNVIRGLQGLNKSLKGGIKATMDWFGKAYSVGDTSMRYVVWKGNQRQLKKMFPDYSVAEIEAAAARLTNNTFQNYDKLSNIIRQVSRAGLADQFVPFTAELTRNMYNQGKYVAQMTAGTFGKDIGLDPTRANKIQMRLHAVKRGAALAAVTAGTDAAITQYNELKGVTNKDEEQFGFSIAPEWDSSKRLIIIPDETGRKGRYVNPSYLVPQGMAAQAFEAGFSGSPVSQLAEFVKDQYLGAPGTFPVRAIGQIISGRDLNGKLISVDPRTQEVAKDFMGVIYDETLKPGAQRTIERWSNSLSGIGDRTTKDNALRMLGIRDYQWDAEKSFTNKLREISEPMRQAKGTYSSALRKFTDNNIPREELDATYEEMNTARRLNMDIMRQHYKNLGGGTWKYSQDERIVMMKEAGVSSADILDIIENTYTDIPKVKAKQTYDIYEELGNTKKEREAAIREIAREDPLLARKLISHHKKIMRVELLKISEVDKLIRTQSPQKRAERLINMGAHKNRALMSEMMQKGIATPEVRHIIKLRAK